MRRSSCACGANVRPVADALTERISRLPGVVAAARSAAAPGDPVGANIFVETAGGGESSMFAGLTIDYGFLEILGVAPRSGRVLAREHASDDLAAAAKAGGEASVLVNDTARARLGLGDAQAAIGQVITLHLGPESTIRARVVGVIPDLHFLSIRSGVEPTVLYRDAEAFDRLTIEVDPAAPAGTMRAIESTWASLVPDVPLVAEPIDARLDEFRQSDRRWTGLLAAFAAIAVLIACAGLYGLSSFVTETRRKEIAIRRVMGHPFATSSACW